MQHLEKELLAAAERGDAEAQYNLGVMLENGVDDNGYAIEGGKAEAMRAEAVKWLLSAAEQDLPRAQLQLAEAYEAGGEPAENLVRAGGWFLVAMTRLSGAHRHRARTGYERVCSRLTPAEIATTKHFAQVWKLKRDGSGFDPRNATEFGLQVPRPIFEPGKP